MLKKKSLPRILKVLKLKNCLKYLCMLYHEQYPSLETPELYNLEGFPHNFGHIVQCFSTFLQSRHPLKLRTVPRHPLKLWTVFKNPILKW
ncbi:unnamed protein product, partial [Staurois parvus]